MAPNGESRNPSEFTGPMRCTDNVGDREEQSNCYGNEEMQFDGARNQ